MCRIYGYYYEHGCIVCICLTFLHCVADMVTTTSTVGVTPFGQDPDTSPLQDPSKYGFEPFCKFVKSFPRYGLKFIMNYKYFPIQNSEKAEEIFSDKSFGGWDIFVHDPDEDW